MEACPVFLFNVAPNENQVANTTQTSLLEWAAGRNSGVDPVRMKHSIITTLRKDRTMKKTLTAGFASLILAGALATPVHALTVAGIDVPDTYSAMGQELQLNGAGTRSKWFMDLYVGGLYVAEKVSDGQARSEERRVGK